jgi:hypothetical protein
MQPRPHRLQIRPFLENYGSHRLNTSVAQMIPFVIHPKWLEGPGTDLPDGEITHLMERTSLPLYLLLLRAQHQI